jgi:hypothetical protein
VDRTKTQSGSERITNRAGGVSLCSSRRCAPLSMSVVCVCKKIHFGSSFKFRAISLFFFFFKLRVNLKLLLLANYIILLGMMCVVILSIDRYLIIVCFFYCSAYIHTYIHTKGSIYTVLTVGAACSASVITEVDTSD